MNFKKHIVYKAFCGLLVMGPSCGPESSSQPGNIQLRRQLAVCPNPLDTIKRQHGQVITRETVNRMFAKSDEKILLTGSTDLSSSVYQIGHRYLLKVSDETLLRQRIAICPPSSGYTLSDLPDSPDLKAIYQSLMQRKQTNPDLPIVDIYAIFDIDAPGYFPSALFDDSCLTTNDNRAPFVGIVMSKPQIYDVIAQDNFRETIPDYEITLLYLKSKGIFLNNEHPENTGYILTDDMPLYEINGKHYCVVKAAKENSQCKKTVLFNFDDWEIKDPLPEAEIRAALAKLINQKVIKEVLPYIGCVVK
ncbi:MAG: hypothetical protein K2X94_03180 [Amoebophilaceae bacterium]|nr:hypothetical protein [Amoebophilaceae bacterium]